MKPHHILLLLFLLFEFNYTIAQVSYKIVVDQTYSSIASADNLISFYKLINEGEKSFLKIKFTDEKTFKKKIAGVGYRIGKFVLIDFPIEHIVHLIQHEIFGHGARYREFGFKKSSYRIKVPPPYSRGGGAARRGENENPNRIMGGHENILTIMAGSESTRLIADNFQIRWLHDEQINYKESLFFLSAFHGYSAYIIGSTIGITEGGDMLTYVRRINTHYGYPDPADYPLDIDDLGKMALINLLNPFQAFATYTYAKKYLLDGEAEFKLPLIKIKNFKYLPSVKMQLSPFGSELFFENFIKQKDRVVNVYYRDGGKRFGRNLGLGIHAYNLLNHQNFKLNTSLDYWNQPSLELGGDQIYQTNDGHGGMIKVSFEILLSQLIPLNLYTQFGYKTGGYMAGERITDGVIWRIGMGFNQLN